MVKINAITVPEGAGAELEARFAARAGAVEHAPGFEAFELLRPVAGESRYFVYTRWASEEAYQAWVSSSAFAYGHRGAGGPGGHPGGQQASVGTGAELLAFEVVTRAGA
ncbi:MAG: antibiotic biosynthesis monooxygenase [Chloroflexota bacterium]